MNREAIKNYVRSLVPMSVEKLELIAEGFERTALAKNEILIRENKISNETYFLESGIVRSYTYDSNGEEVTTHLYSSPCFVNDFLSFFKQRPSSENFQTLTECTIWKMDFKNVQVYFHTSPEFREFGRMMLVTNYSILHERMLGMIKETAENRYLNLMKTQPNVFQHVPLKIIASYLGITDTSLSRIRKELASK